MNEDHSYTGLQSPKPQHNKKAALGATVPGKTEGLPRPRVRFIGFRARPLDPDNFAGGCKDLLDGLRHCRLIPGDEPWKIIFQTEQVKVKTYAEERTVIEIEI